MINNPYAFDTLCSKVTFCSRCPRMDESARILSRAAGPLNAALMFIGEAPGRLGADDSGVPFHGDVAGHNFEELLSFAGISREDVYVTNSVLCNPRDGQGNNATPNRIEVENCSSYLREQIELVSPRIVVTLGSTALQALNSIESHNLALSKAVRTAHAWFGRQLIPLYHPGQRAMMHRSMANQRSDYQFVAEEFRRFGKSSSTHTFGSSRQEIVTVVRLLLGRVDSPTYFALHKLLFLVECEAWKELGQPLTRGFFLRQKDGPYCTDAHLGRLKRSIPELVITGSGANVRLRLKPADMFSAKKAHQPSDTMIRIVEKVVLATVGLTDAQLKTKVYLSSPMRSILRSEKTNLINLYNAPISFTAIRGVSKISNDQEAATVVAV